MGLSGPEMPRIECCRPSEPLKLSCDPDQARFLKRVSEEKYCSDRPAILARFLENRRMTISSHRPRKAKPIQPVGFVLPSYIGSPKCHADWSRERPHFSHSCFVSKASRSFFRKWHPDVTWAMGQDQGHGAGTMGHGPLLLTSPTPYHH